MIIEVNNLVKRYKDLVALDHFNLQVKKGEIYGSARAKRQRQDHCHQLYACPAQIR
mgnify:CR=1 FL=1